jgi:transcriptional regulator with XRE-family HTH domain
MYEEYIINRITELRMEKNISEYQLSLELGYSKGYIQSIVSGRVLPSMKAFLEICSYFDITPKEFFTVNTENVKVIRKIMQDLEKFSDEDLALIYTILERVITIKNYK